MLENPGRFLILDDEQYRHDAFARDLSGHVLQHVRNVEQFRRAIEREPWHWIFFDHDIASDGSTGLDAARALVQLSPAWVPACVVHSFNPTGAMRIFDELHGRFPVYRAMFSGERGWVLQTLAAITTQMAFNRFKGVDHA